MDITFDTNAYRQLLYLLKGFSENEREREIWQLKNCLDKKGITIRINFWVLCEIMQHLCNPNDPAYDDCSKTLKLMLDLSEKDGRAMFSSLFEVSLAAQIGKFPEIEEYFKKLETNVAKLAIEFIRNGRSSTFEKYICDVSKYLYKYKEQIEDGFIIAKEELKKAKVKQIPIDDDSLHILVLVAKLKALFNIDTIDAEVLKELLDINYFGLARTIKVLSKGYHSENLGKSFPNNFVDQAICDTMAKNDDSILVSNDGTSKEGIRTTFIEKSSANRVMTLEEFLKYIEY